MTQYGARHLLIKFSGSRNPVSRRTNQSTAEVTAEAATAELQTYVDKINAEGATEQVGQPARQPATTTVLAGRPTAHAGGLTLTSQGTAGTSSPYAHLQPPAASCGADAPPNPTPPFHALPPSRSSPSTRRSGATAARTRTAATWASSGRARCRSSSRTAPPPRRCPAHLTLALALALALTLALTLTLTLT
jgi:hypothetical protein